MEKELNHILNEIEAADRELRRLQGFVKEQKFNLIGILGKAYPIEALLGYGVITLNLKAVYRLNRKLKP